MAPAEESARLVSEKQLNGDLARTLLERRNKKGLQNLWKPLKALWLRGRDLNLRPLGYEPNAPKSQFEIRLHNVSKTVEDDGEIERTREHVQILTTADGSDNYCQKSRAINRLQNVKRRVRSP